MNKELLELLNLYAQKRRGENIKESFTQLKKSFIESIKKIIASGTVDIDMDKLPVFAMELFESYTNFGYTATEPALELKTIKEVKESKIELDKFKFHINIKESAKKEGDFVYYKQWWKSKHTEGVPVESFIINTNVGMDLRLDKDILNESHTASFYIRNSKKTVTLTESVMFLKPHSESNDTALSSWQKKIDTGKISILESTDWDKTIEFTGGILKGIYTAARPDENADFWDLKIKESQHAYNQCMECKAPPTKEVLWAEGHGHAWFCESHFTKWSAEHKDDICSVKECKDGLAASKFAENTNPNIHKK